VGEGTKDTHGRVIHDGLKLRQRLPMKNARHHWAVRRLRSGSPIHVVQRQLGHESAKLTLDVYGAFVPTGADRDRAEKNATEYEERRRARKMSLVLPRCFPLHEASHALSHTSRENQKARRMRNPLGNRIIRAFVWTSVKNSREGLEPSTPAL